MKTITPVYIEDIIGEVVAATSSEVLPTIQANETAIFGRTNIQQIRYSKSSFDELIETLAQQDSGGSTTQKLKYPLVHFVQDFTVQRGQDVGSYGSTSLNIIFIHQTENIYKIEDRDEKVFKPVLWPIYYEFMAQLFKSKWTWGNNTGEFRHNVTKRAFWGNRKLEGRENKLNDYVDAIEISNLQIKFNFNNCP